MESANVARPRNSVSAGRDTVPEQMIVVLAFLAALLLIAGLLSSWFLKTIDAKFSLLLTQTAKDLNKAQEMVVRSAVGCANMLALSLTSDENKQSELVSLILNERAENDKNFDQLERFTQAPEVRAYLKEVVAKRQAFRERGDSFIAANKVGAGSDLRAETQQLLVSFIAYQKAADKLGDLIQATSLQASARVSEGVGAQRLLLFVLGVFPIVVALILIFLVIFLVTYLSKTVPIESVLEK